MNVYVVTEHFKNPRNGFTKGIYEGVFSSKEEARHYIYSAVRDYVNYTNAAFNTEWLINDFIVIDVYFTDPDQYFCYEIHEEEV